VCCRVRVAYGCWNSLELWDARRRRVRYVTCGYLRCVVSAAGVIPVLDWVVCWISRRVPAAGARRGRRACELPGAVWDLWVRGAGPWVCGGPGMPWLGGAGLPARRVDSVL
jgi:hypothetical protein